MAKCLPDSPTIKRIFRIFLQVILTFVFLTIFFFTYVDAVEKDVFKLQMNTIVDDLYDDMNFRQFVSTGKEDMATILLDGSLDVSRINAMNDTKGEDKHINDQNRKIKNKAFLWVGISLVLLVIIISILVFYGYCIPFHIHTKEAIIVIFFVAITEIIFINIIAKKYLLLNPSEIRHKLGESVKFWIKQNQS
jgi:hypothetical protein